MDSLSTKPFNLQHTPCEDISVEDIAGISENIRQSSHFSEIRLTETEPNWKLVLQGYGFTLVDSEGKDRLIKIPKDNFSIEQAGEPVSIDELAGLWIDFQDSDNYRNKSFKEPIERIVIDECLLPAIPATHLLKLDSRGCPIRHLFRP